MQFILLMYCLSLCSHPPWIVFPHMTAVQELFLLGYDKVILCLANIRQNDHTGAFFRNKLPIRA